MKKISITIVTFFSFLCISSFRTSNCMEAKWPNFQKIHGAALEKLAFHDAGLEQFSTFYTVNEQLIKR